MGRPKGLIEHAPGQTLIGRIQALAETLGWELICVGERAEYASLALPTAADDPAGIGPIGGLRAVLHRAGARRVVIVGVDMPFLDADDLRALAEHPSPAAAAKRAGRWEPLAASFDPPSVLPVLDAQIAVGHHSLSRLLDALGAAEVAIAGDHLRDWDRPEDIA